MLAFLVFLLSFSIAFGAFRTVLLVSSWRKKNTRKSDHITPLFQSLHWLPISLRIQYKINTLFYTRITRTAPSYLFDCLEVYTFSSTLRPFFFFDTLPRSGELRTQRLKSCLVRTQNLNVLPLKRGVGQYIAIHATLTARYFFLAYFYLPVHLPAFFSQKPFLIFFLRWLWLTLVPV